MDISGPRRRARHGPEKIADGTPGRGSGQPRVIKAYLERPRRTSGGLVAESTLARLPAEERAVTFVTGRRSERRTAHLADLDVASVPHEVRDVALGLAALGFKRGERLSSSVNKPPRLYWAQGRPQCLGGVPVPVYQDSIAKDWRSSGTTPSAR